MTETVFPILTYEPKTNRWKCLGTGFFINPVGAFITAKHLFMNKENIQKDPTLVGIQNIDNNEYHVRPVKQLIAHKDSDFMMGMLGKRRIETKEIQPELSKYSVLDLEPLQKGDEIYTYSFPNTSRDDLEYESSQFTFNGTFSYGEIIDFHKNGSPVVRNRCFQTNMKIESGASGGPVFKKGYIVGVNSSSFTLSEYEEPISFITPIDYILDLIISENGKEFTIRELIKSEHIKTKENPT